MLRFHTSAVLGVFVSINLVCAHDGGKGHAIGNVEIVDEDTGFRMKNMELLSHLNLRSLGGVRPVADQNGWGRATGNDIWGWTDVQTGHEYALVGRSDAMVFVDVTDPVAPNYLGYLPTKTENFVFRDIKTYGNYAFSVADVDGHGMQVFDLTRLRGLDAVPENPAWTEDAYYDGFGKAHNLVINPESGFAIGVGSNTHQGALHYVDIQNPIEPKSNGGLRIGYTHDAQAITYRGPDDAFADHEIIFAYTVDSMTIVDATEPGKSEVISRTQYPGSEYAHQGWVTDDQRFVLMNDELDEQENDHNPRTHIWNIEDLESPNYVGFYESEVEAIDHNLYIRGEFAYQANYLSGARILNISDIENGNLTEVAWLDTHPDIDAAEFDGVWSVYPFFESGTILINDISKGLVVAKLAFSKGDFDQNGSVDDDDLMAMSLAIEDPELSEMFDLNDDSVVDAQDLETLVVDILETSYGDANLDGSFDSSDLIAVFGEGQYQDDISHNSNWATGDWDGDFEFGSEDLVLAFRGGTYNSEVRELNLVPEPNSPPATMLLLFLFANRLYRPRRRISTAMSIN